MIQSVFFSFLKLMSLHHIAKRELNLKGYHLQFGRETLYCDDSSISVWGFVVYKYKSIWTIFYFYGVPLCKLKGEKKLCKCVFFDDIADVNPHVYTVLFAIFCYNVPAVLQSITYSIPLELCFICWSLKTLYSVTILNRKIKLKYKWMHMYMDWTVC